MLRGRATAIDAGARAGVGREAAQRQRSAVFDLPDAAARRARPADPDARRTRCTTPRRDLRFEDAARLRDEINELKRELRAAV